MRDKDGKGRKGKGEGVKGKEGVKDEVICFVNLLRVFYVFFLSLNS